ncbi:DUF2878 domain-containing protein [Shewanella sp. AS1]|uniref:DUF2878 domain-containing protein n=1 Tax=Shewanella sp. AS1 TaxID=2907626 RepID=UPI001F23C377|nr:DUF2878 domain-containing protein [Shewanella sp. AS1]MCE9679486.1 DUF2878 domain-containing protein [Shewanella sp. AS1]
MKWFWIINLLLFQLCWFSAALLLEYGALVILLLIAVHFGLSPTPREDAKLLLLVPIGVLVDGLLIHSGVFSSTSPQSLGSIDSLFPLWLLLLWAIFAISFNHSLKWLTRTSFMGVALVGAIGGASSYWAGIKLGRLTTQWNEAELLLLLMPIWAALLPILVLSYRKLLHQHVLR